LIKVLVMAGGIGTRARPFTDFSPKPMMPIFDRPMIDYIVRYLAKSGEIEQILIVTSLEAGRGKQIQNYFDGKESLLGKRIVFVDDPGEGTGGGILKAQQHLSEEEDFLVWFSDNLAAVNVTDLVRFHRAKAALATVAVSRLKRYETGFAEATPGGLVTRFLEKPVLGTPMAECLGIYVFETGIFRYLAEARAKKKNVNLSFDILSRLPAAGRVYAYEMGERPWLDVESASTVERNTDLVRKILDEMQVK